VNIFEITIQRKWGDDWPVVVEHSRPHVLGAARTEGVLGLGADYETILLSQTTPLDYGIVLGKALFHDEVRDAFIGAWAKSEPPLRILLFVEADDLKTLRWERLCAPLDGEWDFLALDQRVPLSLDLPSRASRHFPPIGRLDLRALLVVASPEGLKEKYRLGTFDVEAVVSSVRTALGEKIPCDVLADEVEDAVGPPTLNALCDRLTAERYTLLHIIAHGQYLKDVGETVLYLTRSKSPEKGHDWVDPVSSTRLLRRLRRLRDARGLPYLAFLATCESAKPEAEDALGGLAQQLVRDLAMPAVVAMTEKVSVETAQVLAEGFYRHLREHGEVDRALVEACAKLAERYDAIVPALYSRLRGEPLFSDALDRPLTNAEVRYGLSRTEEEELLRERAPVLEDEFAVLAAKLRGMLGADPVALSKTVRQEREATLTEVNNVCEDALDLTFNALALGQAPPAYDERCPFRGLYPFRVEDREFFFGRGELIKKLKGNLAEHNFLAVLGPSGCGKSSLVLAGLIPALEAEEQMAYLTPGSDPLAQLETSLAKRNDQRAVLVVDQFEELFTLCTDEDKRQAFLNRLLALAEKMRVVITMRADFWGECAPYREFKEVMQVRQELIAPMDAKELRGAMEMQAAKVGLRFEADLANTILDDVRGEPGAMPLLQHALLELWKRRHGRWLLAEEYREKIGGVQKAIARTAGDVYGRLSPEERDRVRDVFVRLTRLGEEIVRGEERRDTRRRVEMEDLVPAGSDAGATKALVTHLADARLVVTGVNKVTQREEVEVAHEALIRHWPRLWGWLNEDEISIRLRESISQAAQEWKEREKDESLLVHRGGRLEDAEGLAKRLDFLNKLEKAYVEACVALRDREEAEKERRTRELEELLARAERETRTARAGQLAAQSQAGLERWPQRRLLLALEALHITVRTGDPHVPIAEDALRQALANCGGRSLGGHEYAIIAVAISPDNHWLVTGSGRYTARLWDVSALLNTGLTAPDPAAAPIVLRGHGGPIKAVAISSDNRWLVTGSWDGTARLWDLTAPNPAAAPIVLRGHKGRINAVAISPDNHWLLTGSADNTARLWRLQLDELMNLACRVAGRNFSRVEWDQYFRGQPYRKTCDNLPPGVGVENVGP